MTQYRWDFGDGNITTGIGLPESGVQTHMYNKIGLYTVEVVASNDHGRNSKSLKIKVGSESISLTVHSSVYVSPYPLPQPWHQ